MPDALGSSRAPQSGVAPACAGFPPHSKGRRRGSACCASEFFVLAFSSDSYSYSSSDDRMHEGNAE